MDDEYDRVREMEGDVVGVAPVSGENVPCTGVEVKESTSEGETAGGDSVGVGEFEGEDEKLDSEVGTKVGKVDSEGMEGVELLVKVKNEVEDINSDPDSHKDVLMVREGEVVWD